MNKKSDNYETEIKYKNCIDYSNDNLFERNLKILFWAENKLNKTNWKVI